MYKLTRIEQETIILYNQEETEAEVYTHDPALIRRLRDLCEKYPDEYRLKGDNGWGGLTFNCPKKRVKVTAPRMMTKSQREQARERAIRNLRKDNGNEDKAS